MDWNSKLLNAVRRKTDRICVAYSGGKDSRVILDLATRIFKKVYLTNFYLVPDMDLSREVVDFATKRYGIKQKDVIYLPHPFTFLTNLKHGTYCKKHDIPEFTMTEMQMVAKMMANCEYILNGTKISDSRPSIKNIVKFEKRGILCPLKNWKKDDVLAYLEWRNIPVPERSHQFVAGGESLCTFELLWIYENYPADYQRILRWFPYAEAVIKRREWFNLPPKGSRPAYRTKPESEARRIRELRDRQNSSV